MWYLLSLPSPLTSSLITLTPFLYFSDQPGLSNFLCLIVESRSSHIFFPNVVSGKIFKLFLLLLSFLLLVHNFYIIVDRRHDISCLEFVEIFFRSGTGLWAGQFLYSKLPYVNWACCPNPSQVSPKPRYMVLIFVSDFGFWNVKGTSWPVLV